LRIVSATKFSVASSRYGHADQSFGEIDVTVVVDSNLSNNKTRLIVADQSVAYPYRTHEKTPPGAAAKSLAKSPACHRC